MPAGLLTFCSIASSLVRLLFHSAARVNMASNGGTYRRVPTTANAGTAVRHEMGEEDVKSIIRKKSRAERISDKFHALCWVIGAGAVIHTTDFFNVFLHDEKIHRPTFLLAVICLVLNTTLMLYLTVYLPKIARVTAPWDVYCPRVIPTMTGIGCLCAILLIRASYPVWGFLSPLILAIVFLGFLFSLHFIPWC